MDEWNYWYGPNEYGELGVRYFLQDALGVAAGLHELFRQSDIFFMANYAQTVNVIGAIKTSNTAILFTNQIRHKIGVRFGSPETTSGGRALKFYASVRLDIRRIASIKDRDQIVGNRVKVKVAKNKVAAPFRQAEFEILYGEGVSREGEIIEEGHHTALLEQGGLGPGEGSWIEVTFEPDEDGPSIGSLTVEIVE